MKKSQRNNAEQGAYAVNAYGMKYGLDESNMRDLLADLMHLCDAQKINFGRELDLARGHYEVEK